MVSIVKVHAKNNSTQPTYSVLTDFKGIDRQSHKVWNVHKMIGAPRSCADILVRGQHQENGGVLIELNGLMDIDLMLIGLLFVEAKVLEEEVDTREESVLEEMRVCR